MYLARTRSLFFLAFIASALIIGTTLYLQHALGLLPCILCFLQRTMIVACGLLCLMATIHAPQEAGWRRYCLALLVLSLTGVLVAGIQIWLQTATTDELGFINAEYEQVLSALSLDGAGERLRSDTYLCAEINWSLFGITLPEWSLLAFVILGLLALYPFFSGLHRWMFAGDGIGY